MVTTIILPVSRDTFLKRVFAQLDMMLCDKETTNLLVYVDGDMRLYDIANNFTLNSKFKQKQCIFRAKGLPNVGSVKSRRLRIAKIHNEIKEHLRPCDYVFLTEDDTIVPLNALQKLHQGYLLYPYAGFITGVQIGRWGFTSLGVWKLNNPYDVKEISSLLPKNGEVEEIDAAGFYCCLTKAANYMKNIFTPFEDVLGPDVQYGVYLRKEGLKNYVDWTINTTHLTPNNSLQVFNTELQKLMITRQGDRWETKVV